MSGQKSWIKRIGREVKVMMGPGCKFKGMFIVLAGFTIVHMSGFVNANEKELFNGDQKQGFLLRSSWVEDKFGLMVQQMEGEIRWLLPETGQYSLYLEVEKISRSFQDPNTRAVALKIQPFEARVCAAGGKEVPLTIEITKGKFENDPLALSTQYRTAYLVLDMMLLTSEKREFVTLQDGSRTTLKITPFSDVKTGDFGVLDIRALRSSVSPYEYRVFPCIGGKGNKGSEVVSFSHTPITVDYYYRWLEGVGGRVTRAVDLRGAMRDTDRKSDYTSLMRIIDDPNQFSSYELHELNIIDIER